jgi:hypothetical protein
VFLLIYVALLLVCLVTMILKPYFKTMTKLNKFVIHRIKIFSVTFEFILENYFPFALCSLLSMNNLVYDTIGDRISTVMTFILLAVTIIFPFWLLILVKFF